VKVAVGAFGVATAGFTAGTGAEGFGSGTGAELQPVAKATLNQKIDFCKLIKSGNLRCIFLILGLWKSQSECYHCS